MADMSLKQFQDACARRGIAHNGGDWNDGTYYPIGLDGPGVPVGRGTFQQLDTSSRRALLSHLIKWAERLQRDRQEREGLRGLQRGDRIVNGMRHGIVLVPIEGTPGGGFAVSYDGKRECWKLRDCQLWKGGAGWTGPVDLESALILERQALLAKLDKIDRELEACPRPGAVRRQT